MGFFNYNECNTINSRNITVNGRTINVTNGANVTVINGDVFINGEKYEFEDGFKVGSLTIQGNCGDIKCDGNLTVVGLGGNANARGNINSGNIGGNVDCRGNCICGDIKGSVSARGNIIGR